MTGFIKFLIFCDPAASLEQQIPKETPTLSRTVYLHLLLCTSLRPTTWTYVIDDSGDLHTGDSEQIPRCRESTKGNSISQHLCDPSRYTAVHGGTVAPGTCIVFESHIATGTQAPILTQISISNILSLSSRS